MSQVDITVAMGEVLPPQQNEVRDSVIAGSSSEVVQAPPSESRASSPPPNCAICLGNCMNRCMPDTCLHQFCFKCLLEWSKVKAVCPLCKQTFNKIIHNVQSNSKYDEHLISANVPEDDFDDFFRTNGDLQFYLPTVPAVPGLPSSSRHFQFRTTLTVDPRGELAIQQLLSTQPMTNPSIYEIIGNGNSPTYQNYYRLIRRRLHRDVSSTNYRRGIYQQDLWVNAPPDVTGRYRDISPQYYQENPAARNRLVPWLNRELNALLHENTQHVMYVVDVILSQLNRHHIQSRHFKQLLEEFFSERTDHFIHEFYNFMRSPFDMIGYDRHIFYTHGSPPQFSIHLNDESETDSDVAVVSVSQPRDPVVIEINSDSSRESDVIMREPTPPVVVDLVDSDEPATPIEPTVEQKPIYPLKIRLKHKRQKRSRKRRHHRHETNDSSSTDSSSDFSEPRSRRHKSKYYIVKDQNAQSDNNTENESILSRLEKIKGKRTKRTRRFYDELYRKKRGGFGGESSRLFKRENTDTYSDSDLDYSHRHVKYELPGPSSSTDFEPGPSSSFKMENM